MTAAQREFYRLINIPGCAAASAEGLPMSLSC